MTVLAVAIVACGFPSVSFLPGDAGSDAAGLDAAGLDASIDATQDRATPPLIEGGDATKPPPLEGGNACDKDGDGHKAPGPMCNGDDCDDDDWRANPGVTTWVYDLANVTTQGDWNCDKTVDVETPALFKCGDYSTSCASHAGFDGNPACGDFGTYVTCKANPVLLLPCVNDTTKMKRQGCK